MPSYLRPTQYGFVTVDWDALRRDSNYDAVRAAALGSGRDAVDGQLGFDRRRGHRRCSRRSMATWKSATTACATTSACARLRPISRDLTCDRAGFRQRITTARAEGLPDTVISSRPQTRLRELAAVGKRVLESDRQCDRARRSVQDHDSRRIRRTCCWRLVDPQRRRIAGRTRAIRSSIPISPTTSTWASSTTPARRVTSVSPRSAKASRASRSGRIQTIPFGDLAPVRHHAGFAECSNSATR